MNSYSKQTKAEKGACLVCPNYMATQNLIQTAPNIDVIEAEKIKKLILNTA